MHPRLYRSARMSHEWACGSARGRCSRPTQELVLGGQPSMRPLADQAGQAEVGDLDLPAGGPKEVLGLDVAVHQAVLVGVLQAQGRLEGVLARLARGQRHPVRASQSARFDPSTNS